MAHYFLLTFFKAGKHSGSFAIHPVQPEITTTDSGAELGEDMLLAQGTALQKADPADKSYTNSYSSHPGK